MSIKPIIASSWESPKALTVMMFVMFVIVTTPLFSYAGTPLDLTLPDKYTDPLYAEKHPDLNAPRPVPSAGKNVSTVELPPGTLYDSRNHRFIFPKRLAPNQQIAIDPRFHEPIANANAELIFLSKQLYEIFHASPHADQAETNRINFLRSSLQDQINSTLKQDQAASFGAYGQTFYANGVTRFKGIAHNVALPAVSLLMKVLNGTASDNDFKKVGDTLNLDPDSSGETSIHILRMIRGKFNQAEQLGYRFGPALQEWIRNTDLVYAVGLRVDGTLSVQPTHKFSAIYSGQQLADPNAHTRISVGVDVCRSSLSYSQQPSALGSCTEDQVYAASYGRDISRMQSRDGRYWSWAMTFNERQRDSDQISDNTQEALFILKIPLN